MNLGMESETVEHKRSTSEMREAMESVASILNKHGSGSLYFGVRPSDGEVVGQDVSEKTLRDISQAFTNCIEPRVVPTIERFETDDGRAYVKVVFSGEDRPYACNGRYRIRSADEDLPMGSAILEQMMLERAERRESWDGRPSGKGIGDVAPGIVRRIVESGAARDRIPEPYTTDEAALGGLGLIAQDGSLTNAAAILFCKGGSPFRLTMGAVAGNDRSGTILDLRQEDGPVFDLVDRAEHFVMANIRRRLVFGTGVAREEVPEIPRAAVREAVVNAFCHRDWQDSSAVVIDVFTDTVRITNPGLFPEGKPPESFMAGVVTPSKPRNPLLANALYKGGAIEAYGSGIRRIKLLCGKVGVRFGYRQERGCTTIVFERPGSLLVNSEEGRKVVDNLSSALALFANATPLASQDVAESLGVGLRQAQRILRELEDKGLVERSGRGRGTLWSVVRGK